MRWKFMSKLVRPLAYLVVIGLIGSGVWFGRPYWQPLLGQGDETAAADQEASQPIDEPKVLELGAQARANLKLTASPVKVQTYWRTIQIPGVIEDRPGITDRGITAPLGGVITQVHAFEGDIIQPGARLFTLRLLSPGFQTSSCSDH